MEKNKMKKLMFLMMLFGLMSVAANNASAQACNPNDNQIAVYQDWKFTGGCKVLNVGEYANVTTINVENDDVSSVKVGKNVKAMLCEHFDFGGVCQTFESDNTFLEGTKIGNDMLSSIKVMNKNAQGIMIGSVVNLENQYPKVGGYLDSRGRVKDKPEFQKLVPFQTLFVLTSPSPKRDNGSGNWKIVSATGKAGNSILLYGDKIHLMNMYQGAGYLDSSVYVRDMPMFKDYPAKIGVFTNQSNNRDNGSGTWIVRSASSKADGTPVDENDNILLENGFPGGGFLDTVGYVTQNPSFKEYQGSSLLVFVSESNNRDNGSGTWKITSSKVK
jgi:hypothetical protein